MRERDGVSGTNPYDTARASIVGRQVAAVDHSLIPDVASIRLQVFARVGSGGSDTRPARRSGTGSTYRGGVVDIGLAVGAGVVLVGGIIEALRRWIWPIVTALVHFSEALRPCSGLLRSSNRTAEPRYGTGSTRSISKSTTSPNKSNPFSQTTRGRSGDHRTSPYLVSRNNHLTHP